MTRTIWLVRIGVLVISTLVSLTGGYVLWQKAYHRRNGIRELQMTILHQEDFVMSDIGSLKNFYEFQPNTIIDDRPQWLHFTPIETINDDGLNERRSYPVDKPEGTFRIMTIGDSVTFGQYVNTKDNYAEVLEDRLNATGCHTPHLYEVINLGVPGYDIAYTVEHFVRKGSKYRPDLVIWVINNHNLFQLMDVLQQKEQEIQQGMSKQDKEAEIRNGHYYAAMIQARNEMIALYGKSEILRKQYDYFRQFSEVYAGPLLVVTFASNRDIDANALLYRMTHERTSTWWYRTLPDNIELRYVDNHPNAEGHKAIAEAVQTYLFSNALVPCFVR